jgi:autotransporter-associated beta strand protein
LEQRGLGVLTLAGQNSYSGNLDIGQGTVVLGHNQALGQGEVVSSGGTLGLSSSVVLPRLRVNGDITLNTAMRTTADQVYNNHVTFTSSGVVTPVDADNDPARVANFESTQGSIAFMGTVGAGLGAKAARRSLVVSAERGRVTFNDQVGLSALDPLAAANSFQPADYASFSQRENNSPWAVDVLGQTIAINANITSSQTQLYTGSVLVGNNGNNGFSRLLLSLDPAITFNGSIDDTINGRHSLILRAISTDPSEVPSIQVENVGQTTPLAGFDLLTGQQAPNSLVTQISMDRTTFAGDVLLGGSVRTVGDQTYVGRSIRFDDTGAPIVLDTDAGTIEILPGLTPSNDPNTAAQSVEVQGLGGVRFALGVNALGLGQNLRNYANERGLNLSVTRRLPPPPLRPVQVNVPAPLTQTGGVNGSALAALLKRSIEPRQQVTADVEEWMDATGLTSTSGQVAVGQLQAAQRPDQDLSNTSLGMNCSESAAAAEPEEACPSNAQN